MTHHTDAELERRVTLQKEIHFSKKSENERRDRVPRTCVLCKSVFPGRAAAAAHATPIGQDGTQCPVLVAFFLQHMQLLQGGGASGEAPPKVTFTTPEPVEHVMTTPPQLDGSFWGSEFEKFARTYAGPATAGAANSVVVLDFYNDVCFNPFGGWWAGFSGAFNAHGKPQKGPKDGGAANANDYFATQVLPSPQKPNPLSGPEIYARPVLPPPRYIFS